MATRNIRTTHFGVEMVLKFRNSFQRTGGASNALSLKGSSTVETAGSLQSMQDVTSKYCFIYLSIVWVLLNLAKPNQT